MHCIVKIILTDDILRGFLASLICDKIEKQLSNGNTML